MSWKNSDLSNNIFQAAMYLCDTVGVSNFRQHFGATFESADNIHIYWEDKNGQRRGPYEARPLIAAAYSIRYPDEKRLKPADFFNNDAHSYLKEQGFSIEKIN